MRVFLRAADGAQPYDGEAMEWHGAPQALPDTVEKHGRTFHLTRVRCGTTSWIEYWDAPRGE